MSVSSPSCPVLALEEAVMHLKSGQLIAYPTEAVFGVGCDPKSETALQALLELKQRPREKGLILIAGAIEQLNDYVDWSALTSEQVQRVQSSWPAPITWIVPVRPEVSSWVTGVHTTIAVRVTDHPCVIELCQSFGGAIISTSANVSAMPPARSHEDLCAQFGDQIACLAGELGGRPQPSTIFDAQTGKQLRGVS